MPRAIKGLPHPDSAVVDLKTGRMTQEWYARFSDLVGALVNRIAVSGSVTFAASTTAAVSFATPEASADYDVFFASTDATTYWATAKTVNGFTANASASSSATLRWQLLRA